jgi:hypothetical protein
MKNIAAFLVISMCLLLLLQACSPSTPEFNVDTAVAQLESEMNVETAVAQLQGTQTAAVQPAASIVIPTGTTQPQAEQSTCTLNVACEAAGISLTVTAISSVSEIGYYWKAPEGFTYLVIDVTIKNVDRDQSPYNPVWFVARDGQGREAVGNNYAPLPDLQYGTLARGDEVSGKVSFQMSSDATDFVITYLPIDPAGGYLPIQVEIGNP